MCSASENSEIEFSNTYSKASRYTASRSADLGDARFLIGSQNTWDTLFWAESLEDARFLIGSQNTWDKRILAKSLEDTRFLIFWQKKIMPNNFIEI